MRTRPGTVGGFAKSERTSTLTVPLTDADALAKFEGMTPAERALALIKSAPAQRFTPFGLRPT